MKKLFTLIFAVVFTAGIGLAQETFQGTLSYGFEFMGDGVEQYKAMMPTGMTMKVRKKDMIVEIEGGMMAMMMGRVLVKGKKGKSYMIKDSEKTIYVMDPEKMQGEDDTEDAEMEQPEPTITKEDETIEVAGYPCQKYRVETMTPQGPATQYVWVTEDLKLPETKTQGMQGGLGSSLSIEGLPGMALKSMTTQGPVTVILTANKIETGKLDKKEFKLPKGYDKQDFDPEAMFGGMGG